MGLLGRKYSEIGMGVYWDGFLDVLYSKEYAAYEGYREHLSLGLVQVTAACKNGLVDVYDSDNSLLLSLVSADFSRFYTYYRQEGLITMTNLARTYAQARFSPHAWDFADLTLYRHVSVPL